MRVRLYPHGEVFELGEPVPELNAIRLRLTDKKTYESKGTRLIPADRVFWLEPTTRQHPPGTAQTRLDPPPHNDLDVVIGS